MDTILATLMFIFDTIRFRRHTFRFVFSMQLCDASKTYTHVIGDNKSIWDVLLACASVISDFGLFSSLTGDAHPNKNYAVAKSEWIFW
jgi:hypothetical protein